MRLAPSSVRSGSAIREGLVIGEGAIGCAHVVRRGHRCGLEKALQRRRDMGQTISFKRPNGQNVQGYLAEPAGGRGPGVVVIQEWWGLNAQIRGVADRMAGAGYRALVPDLYRGKVTVEAKEAEHLMGNLDFGDAAGQDVRGAVQHLKALGNNAGAT